MIEVVAITQTAYYLGLLKILALCALSLFGFLFATAVIYLAWLFWSNR